MPGNAGAGQGAPGGRCVAGGREELTGVGPSRPGMRVFEVWGKGGALPRFGGMCGGFGRLASAAGALRARSDRCTVRPPPCVTGRQRRGPRAAAGVWGMRWLVVDVGAVARGACRCPSPASPSPGT